jgi:VanZ family protein
VRRATTWTLAAVAYAALIYWLSAQPNPLPWVPRGLLTSDKVVHALEYALLGALAALALGARGVRPGRALLLAAVLASAYGASDEIHQSFVPNREADAGDWAADTVGAILGAGGVAAALRRRNARASIPP